jgi:hypothetical protein
MLKWTSESGHCVSNVYNVLGFKSIRGWVVFGGIIEMRIERDQADPVHIYSINDCQNEAFFSIASKIVLTLVFLTRTKTVECGGRGGGVEPFAEVGGGGRGVVTIPPRQCSHAAFLFITSEDCCCVLLLVPTTKGPRPPPQESSVAIARIHNASLLVFMFYTELGLRYKHCKKGSRFSCLHP